VTVRAGALSIINGGVISSNAFASVGNPGQVTVTAGDLSIVGSGSKVESSTSGSGSGGGVAVTAESLRITDFGQITSTSSGAGRAGDVSVNVTGGQPGALTILSNGSVNAGTSGAGDAGSVFVTVAGGLSIDGSGTDPNKAVTGISSQANRNSKGNAGGVTVSAGSLSIVDGGAISTTTFESGNAGNVFVTAGGLSIASSGEIVSNTKGSGKGGSVLVKVDGQLTIDGIAPIANLLTEVAADSEVGSTGNGGDVTVTAGALSIINGGGISSSALGSTGNAGPVTVTAGILTLGNAGLIASATAGSGGGGNVSVTAGSLMIAGGDVTSSSFGTGLGSGRGGNISVEVTGNQPGALTILADGVVRASNFGPGDAGSVAIRVAGGLSIDGTGTRISSQANRGSSGNAGDVSISAGALSITGGAKISTSTAGAGKGGGINIAVASDIVLPDPGPQITAQSTGSGDAGSISVSARRLLLSNRAKISTEADTSTANGGNITLHLRDLLYLVSSEISTSVKGETGNGGNIVIDPPLVILDHSLIKADAIAGHGGNIKITADPFVSSSDSSVEATSERGVSGTVVINGLVNANGALVVLSTQLRGRTEVLREACAARADRPISSLVEAGRGGLPQDPEATLPALYIAGRDVNPNPQIAPGTTEPSGTPLHTTARLTMRCG
jgi:hypothetical protein